MKMCKVACVWGVLTATGAAAAMPTFNLLVVDLTGPGHEPIAVVPGGQFFQHQNGSNYPPDNLLFGDFPSLEFDSYIAISPRPSEPGFTAFPPDSSFPAGFNQTDGHFDIPNLLRGGWQVPLPGVQSVMNPNSGLPGVFVARLTVPDGNVLASEGIRFVISGEPPQSLPLIPGGTQQANTSDRTVRGGRVFQIAYYKSADDQVLSSSTVATRGVPVLWDTFDVWIEELTPPCPGDANGDSDIDIADLNLVLGNFGTGGPAGDVNGSGSVDIDDLNLVIGNFGNPCP